MENYKKEFIEFALEKQVLRFGDFTLKSGRKSPYFFNSGLFNDGESLLRLGQFYTQAIKQAGIDFDMVYGPAYKGIPLASAVAIALNLDHKSNVPYCFNRKEEKDHGEGGQTLGAELKGRVLIIDDVITAGTSVNQSVDIIHQAGAESVAVVIALDRQEKGKAEISAIQEVEQSHKLKVISIINLRDLIEYLGKRPDLAEDLKKIQQYQADYGVK